MNHINKSKEKVVKHIGEIKKKASVVTKMTCLLEGHRYEWRLWDVPIEWCERCGTNLGTTND